MSFDAKKQNKLIIEKGRELAEEHRKMMAAQFAADKKKYKDGYVPDVTFKRPSQELMDQIKKRNDAKEKRYKEEHDAAYKRSVARITGAKGGRRTRRHKHSNKKHRGKSNKKKRMSRRR